jgi:hypothetical protein
MVFAFQLMDAVVTGTYSISFMQFAGITLDSIAAIVFSSRIADVVGVLLSGPVADLVNRRNVGRLSITLTTMPDVRDTLRRSASQIREEGRAGGS